MTDICMDPIRADLEYLKTAWEEFVKKNKEREQEWQHSESMAAIRVIERTLKYEVTYEQAVCDLGDAVRKSIAAGSLEADADVVVATVQFSEDYEASKQPDSHRLTYLAISRYLKAAEVGFVRIEEQTSAWSGVLPPDLVTRLEEEISLIRGDKNARYEYGKDCQKSIAGAIVAAQAAAGLASGCIDYRKLEHSYAQLRLALYEVRSVYCRILCVSRHTGILVQGLVRDNLRVALLEVARYLELSFRAFEGVRHTEADCGSELTAILSTLASQVTPLQTEIARWSKSQSSVNAVWQSDVVSLNTYVQQVSYQASLLQATSANANRKILDQISVLVSRIDDSLRSLFCWFEKVKEFRIEAFDPFWGSLVETRCALACYYREEKEDQRGREEKLAQFFELFDFLKSSSTQPPSGQPALVATSAGVSSPAPLPTPLAAPMANSSQIADGWRDAKGLLATLAQLAPDRMKGLTEKLAAQVDSEISLFSKGAVGTPVPADVLLGQAQQAWGELYAQLSVVVAIEKDALQKRSGGGGAGVQLDAFSASLLALNQKMLSALDQNASISASTAATGGA